MTLDEIKQAINSESYEFLKKNEHLGSNICLLTLGGSHAYGLETAESDLDIRGCTLNTAREILLNDYYDQFTNVETDTVIYSFNKLLSLLTNCNPNVIEMLGCKSEHYLYVSKVGQALLDNKDLFLSKRCINSFGGYANQQLRRLQNAMARDSYPKAEREKHILNTIRNMKYHLNTVYGTYDESMMKLYIDKSLKEDMETEIYMDFNLKHFPLRNYRGIMAEMNTVINEYSKLNKRNTKKDAKHLMKHMASLLRLYMMALDILESKKIVTYREAEHDLLMGVRNNDYLEIADDETIEYYQKQADKLRADFAKQTFSDPLEYEMAQAALERDIEKLMTGIYKVTDAFWDILDQYEMRFEYAKKHTELPQDPDYKRIQDFKEEINLSVIKAYI